MLGVIKVATHIHSQYPGALELIFMVPGENLRDLSWEAELGIGVRKIDRIGPHE